MKHSKITKEIIVNLFKAYHMKIQTIVMLALMLASFTLAQPDMRTEPDPRLFDALSKSEIAEMQEKNPFLIQYYNYFLDHSYRIIDQPKSNQLNLPVVDIPNIDNFNILVVKKEQKLKRAWESQTYYTIKNTDKVLVFISEREFTQKLNEAVGK